MPAGNGIEAGRLEVEVVGDTTGFARALQAKIDAAVKGVTAVVDVDANTKALRDKLKAEAEAAGKGAPVKVPVDGDTAPLRRKVGAEKQAQERGDGISIPVTAHAEAISVEVDRIKKSAERQARIDLAVRAYGDGTAKDVEKIKAEVRAKIGKGVGLPVYVDKNNLQTLTSGLSSVTTAAAGIAPTLLKVGGIATAIGAAVPAVVQLASGLFAVVAAAGPVVGVLGAIPGLAGAGIVGIGGMVLGLGGVKDALKKIETGGPAAEKALAGMPAPVVALAKAIHSDVMPAFDALKNAATTAIAPGILAAMNTVVGILPIVQRAVVESNTVIGQFLSDAAASMASPQWTADFNTMVDANTVVMGHFTGVGLALMEIFRNVGIAAAPLVERIAAGAEAFALWGQNAAQTGRDTGTLEAFFSQAGTTAAQLGRILRDLGVAILNVGGAAFKSGQGLLDSFEGATYAAREWTSEVGNTERLKVMFDSMANTLRETGRLFNDLGAALFRIGAGNPMDSLVKQIRADLLPAVERLLTALASGGLGESLVSLATNLTNLLTAISGPGGGGFTAFVNTLNMLAGALLQVLSIPGLGSLAGILLQVGGAVAALSFAGKITGITSLVGSFGNAEGAARRFFAAMTGGEAAGLAGTIGSAARSMGSFALDTVQATGRLVAQGVVWGATRLAMLAAATAQGVVTAAQWALNTAMSANPIGLIVLAIAALVAGLIYAYTHFQGFRDAVDGALHAVGDAFGWLRDRAGEAVDWIAGKWRELTSTLSSVWSSISDTASHVWDTIIGAASTAWNAVVGAVSTAWNAITGAIELAIGVIVTALRVGAALFLLPFILFGMLLSATWDAIWGALGGRLTEGWAIITAALSAGLAWLTGLWNAAWSNVTAFFAQTWALIQAAFSAAWGWFTGALGAGLGWLTGVWNTAWSNVTAFFATAWALIQAAFSAAWGWFSGAIGAGLSWLTGVWNAAWSNVSAFFSTAWALIQAAFSAAWSWFSGAISAGLGWLQAVWSAGWNNVLVFFTGIWASIRGAFDSAWGGMSNAISNALGWLQAVWSNGWNNVLNIANSIFGAVRGAVDGLVNGIANSFSWVRDTIGGIWDGVREKFAGPLRWVINTVWNNGLRAAWNTAARLVGLGELGEVRIGFRDGGPVPGGYGGGDKIRALLEPGEFVVTKDGGNLGAALNHFAGRAGYALGGIVDAATGRQRFGLGGVVGSAFEGLGDKLGGGIDGIVKFFRNGIGAGVAGLLQPVRSLLNSAMPAGQDWKGLLNKTGNTVMDKIVEFIKGRQPTSGGASGGDWGVLPHVAAIGHLVQQIFGIRDIGGYRVDSFHEHDTGHVLDLMVSNKSLGDALNAFLLSLPQTKYDIWNQAMWYPGKGPRGMADRGSPTQNHMDHVHWFSNATGGSYAPIRGGALVRVAEAGRTETIVDTGTLNQGLSELAQMISGLDVAGGRSVEISTVVNNPAPEAASESVNRRMRRLAAFGTFN